MDEWWTYRLSDFLLFSPQTYYRLLELYNAAIWPLQILALACGGAIAVLLWRRPAWRDRAVSVILAVCWLWVAWAFHLQRYATINWAAVYFAWGFFIEAALLVWIGVIRNRLVFTKQTLLLSGSGVGMFLFALVIEPLLAPLAGRPWTQAEFFGVAPDPTAIATLGMVLLAGKKIHWGLFFIPFFWCVISAATLWAMKSPQALIMLLSAMMAVVTIVLQKLFAKKCL